MSNTVSIEELQQQLAALEQKAKQADCFKCLEKILKEATDIKKEIKKRENV